MKKYKYKFLFQCWNCEKLYACYPCNVSDEIFLQAIVSGLESPCVFFYNPPVIEVE